MKGQKWDNCNSIINKYIKKKVLEENIGRKISDIPCSNVLTDTSPKACDKKENRKLDI